MLKCVDTEGGKGGSATMHGTRTRRLYRATHVQLRDIYSECTKYTQYSCMRSRPRICVCVCARATSTACVIVLARARTLYIISLLL